MLDLDHLQTAHIFTASRLQDAILALSKRMISAPASDRYILSGESEEPLNEMRKLNLEHFGGSQFIFAAIDDLQAALQRLAAETHPQLGTIMPSLARLRGKDGFQTDFI